MSLVAERKSRLDSRPRKPRYTFSLIPILTCRRKRGTDLERLFIDGPNPYGRRGRQKCDTCRFHRVKVCIPVLSCASNLKCEYNERNPSLPCKRCVEKGYACSEKRLGPKSQAVAWTESVVALVPSTSMPRPISMSNDFLTTNDLFYLQFYRDLFCRNRSPRELIYIPSTLTSWLPFYPIDIDMTCTRLKIGILFLSSFLWNNRYAEDVQVYRALLFNESSPPLHWSFEYSLWYFLVIYRCLQGLTVRVSLIFCGAFCAVIAFAMGEQAICPSERSWILKLWASMLRAIYHLYWFDEIFLCDGDEHKTAKFEVASLKCIDLPLPAGPPLRFTTAGFAYGSLDHYRDRLKHFVRFFQVLIISESFADSEDWCPDLHIRILNMSIYLQVYLELFLLQAGFTCGSDSEFQNQVNAAAANDEQIEENTVLPAGNELVQSLQTIVDLIERLPRHANLIDYWFRYYNILWAPANSSHDSSDYYRPSHLSQQSIIDSVD